MKSVIASLKPYFYYLVGEGIKKIEVRKSKPKADDWNRETYFYMSKDEKSFEKIPKEYQDKYRKHFGKVGLKFVCDRIDEYILILDYNGDNYSTRDFMYYPAKDACLSQDEIVDYGAGKDLYGWHISDLKIYDKPKELSEFVKTGKDDYCDINCKHLKTKGKPLSACDRYCDKYETYLFYNDSFIRCNDCFMDDCVITKAPQSWGYCEELEK